MTPEEIEDAGSKSESAIRLCCNDYHPHSAHNDCLSGDPRDITILKLIEHIHWIESAVDKAQRRVQGEDRYPS